MFETPHNIPRPFGSTETMMSAFRATADSIAVNASPATSRGEVMLGGVRSQYFFNRETKAVEFWFYAEVVGRGPLEGDTEDLTGPKYWLRACVPVTAGYGTTGRTDTVDLQKDSSVAGFTVCGTNLAEINAGTHWLRAATTYVPGDKVLVRLALGVRAGEPDVPMMPDTADQFTFDRQPGPGVYYLTGVTGSFPKWTYSGKRVIGYDPSQVATDGWVLDTVATSLVNAAEFGPLDGSTYPYVYGNGVSISDSAGTVGDSACVIVHIGLRSVVSVTVVPSSVDKTNPPAMFFTAMNSAEIPA